MEEESLGLLASLNSLVEAEEEEGLLKEVCGQGGFAYGRLALQARAGDASAAEASHDMAWEHLHSAPWHSVHGAWRDAFSLSCLYLASFRARARSFHDALRFLDMGVIMGGPRLRLHLHSAISSLQPSVSSSASIEATHSFFDNAWSKPNLLDHTDGFERKTASNSLQLPLGSLGSTLIQKRTILSLEDFLCDFFLPNKPVVVTDAMVNWPAAYKWRNLEYLQKVVGTRTVPVEVGEHYLASGWKQELMRVSELLEKLQSPDSSPATRVYLAQHPLFDQIPELRQDILIPDYCTASGGEIHSINAWLGPAGTVTPLHHDPHHNILAQVVGEKYIRLYPCNLSESLYPYSDPMLSNSSQVDIDNLDSDKFPLAKELPFMDCILKEGQMLYIPPKCWHYVKSLSPSFSVNFWWNTPKDIEITT